MKFNCSLALPKKNRISLPEAALLLRIDDMTILYINYTDGYSLKIYPNI